VITAVPEEPTRRATAKPVPTVTPPPKATARRQDDRDEGYWVQVLASAKPATIETARGRLGGLGFGAESQRVDSSMVAGGKQIHKLRIGPFPDRESADRVARRMRDSGYPDAWIVSP
jgi:cell division septation protein DedD